jgi:hypothetical protein
MSELIPYNPENIEIVETPPKVSPDPSYNVFSYGQDIARWAVLKPYTLNHVQMYSYLSILDGIATTSLQFSLSPPSVADNTTRLIFDFGRLLRVRGAFLSTSLYEQGDINAASSYTFFYSVDGNTWVTIDSFSMGGSSATTFYKDLLMAEQIIRYFKVEYYTKASNAGSYTGNIYQFTVLV